MESMNESQSKGKHFMITTKSDYTYAVKEVKAMLKYIYPNRKKMRDKNTKVRTHLSSIVMYPHMLKH